MLGREKGQEPGIFFLKYHLENLEKFSFRKIWPTSYLYKGIRDSGFRNDYTPESFGETDARENSSLKTCFVLWFSSISLETQ